MLDADHSAIDEDDIERVWLRTCPCGNRSTCVNNEGSTFGRSVAVRRRPGEGNVRMSGKIKIRPALGQSGDRVTRAANDMLVADRFRKVERVMRDQNLCQASIDAAEKTSGILDLPIADASVRAR